MSGGCYVAVARSGDVRHMTDPPWQGRRAFRSLSDDGVIGAASNFGVFVSTSVVGSGWSPLSIGTPRITDHGKTTRALRHAIASTRFALVSPSDE